MEKKKHSFLGTLIAVAAIIILAIMWKFAYKEDFKREEIYFEPTEPTYSFFEGTKITASPTEFVTE